MICEDCYFLEDFIIDSDVSGLPIRVEKRCGFWIAPDDAGYEEVFSRSAKCKAEAEKRGSCTRYMNTDQLFEVTNGTSTSARDIRR